MIDEREQQNREKRSHSYVEGGSIDSQPSSTRIQAKANGPKVPIVFFGNEKLATGLPDAQPIIRNAVEQAGFKLEQHVTGKLSELQEHESTLAVLAAYGRIIPQTVLDQFPLGIINIHPSLLPAYRGPTPIEQAMLDGVTKTGVSIMRLTAGMDEGPIYKQKVLHLTGNDSKIDLTLKLQTLGAELLIEVLPGIADGSLAPRSQPHTDRATYSQKLTKDDGVIEWSKPAVQLEREIRAYAEWPKSQTELSGRQVTITKARVIPGEGAPGEIRVVDKDLLVFCGEESLLIEQLKPAGKNEMNAEAFINGYLKMSS